MDGDAHDPTDDKTAAQGGRVRAPQSRLGRWLRSISKVLRGTPKSRSGLGSWLVQRMLPSLPDEHGLLLQIVDNRLREDGELARVDAALRHARVASPYDVTKVDRVDERLSVVLREFLQESVAFQRAMGLTRGFKAENVATPADVTQ